MKERDPTRREFLLELARKAAYTAPVITTFAVAPAILQGESSQHKKDMGMMSPPAQTPGQESSGRPRPSEVHPPPSRKN